MKEIQEKRIQKEISILETTVFFERIQKKISKDEMYIDLSCKHPYMENESISFILHVCSNYPFNPPKLFCKSPVNNI